MKYFLSIFLCSIQVVVFAQSPKKPLDHSTYDIWNTVKNVRITNDGKWSTYQIQPGKGDGTVKLFDEDGVEQKSFERSKNASFSWDSDHLIFKITAPYDTIINMRRRKLEKEDLPKDSLAILYLKSLKIEKIPNVKSYSLPPEWSGHVAYLLDPIKILEDTTIADSLKVIPKPNNDENGYTLILRELKTSKQDTFKYVLDYKFSKYNNQLFLLSSGDSTFHPGVYQFDCNKARLKSLHRTKGKYKKLTASEDGTQVAFLADLDTAKYSIRYHGLYYWNQDLDSARLVADTTYSIFEKNWLVSEHDSVYFSQNGKRLFFGTSPKPLMPDTTLLEEEIVDVEVWSYKDQRLHTQQNIELKEDQKKGYACWVDAKSRKITKLESTEIPDILLADEGNGKYGLGIENKQYQKYISWEGGPIRNDFYLIELKSGNAKKVKENLRSHHFNLSPKGNYFYWIDIQDSTWHAYSVSNGTIVNLTGDIAVQFTHEIHDAPTPPYPYGIAGWTEDDRYILIYDRYDIWKIDPEGIEKPIKLTAGRVQKKVYRYLKLDDRERFIDSKKDLLLHTYNEVSRDEGYAGLNIRNGKLPVQIIEESLKFSRPTKALKSDQLIFTKQSFSRFPDLILSDLSFKDEKQISHANPQQNQYKWGKGEIVKWTSLDGKELEGMLFKPDNFDPNKKYPMIVNFYEKSSQNLHYHRYPKPERSTINYALYVSNGYIIFNPDVHYRIGYPGESCYNSVIPGVTKLIDQGFIDKNRIGIQGHSWGGYQIAYLVTKTDMFAAAESGAPVPNMISAYGGIRWWTGLSRMFQYEHTQSRIGGTLWEYPLRFIENSPIFFMDKVNTPLLIMHNDADGHVPWYQGIEMFVALRRLGKPSWMLNYPGEPHWPLKRQNQIDFNIRMMQFFDHYLKGTPEPKWLHKGVPAIEKGIDLGYELVDD